jgi:hypothetical protein
VFVAAQANQVVAVAVVFDNLLAARRLMQVIDILGDDDAQLPLPLQLGQGQVGRVGRSPAKEIVKNFFNQWPAFIGVGGKVVDVQKNRVVFIPQPVGAALGGDAAFH